ncbi:hypothetical protein PG984_006967 [Apiospora sp. TS-2023a]
MALPVLARTNGVPVSLCLRWPGASSAAKLRPALTWHHSTGNGARFSSSPSAAAATRRAPAPHTLSWPREFTPEAERVLMRTVRHFCERLEFAKTGIPTTIHGNLKPYLPLLPPSAETAGAEEVVANVAEAQRAGAKEKRHAHLTVLIIVGGEVWHGLKRWLFEKTERSGNDTPEAYAKRVRVRCHLFTAISGALQRWDPDDSSERTRKFFATSVRLVRDHIDLLPLVIEALKGASSRPSRSRDDFKNLLVVAKREAFRFEAELELLRAELCLNHPDLYRSLPPAARRPPLQEPSHRWNMMHRWAARRAHLLEREGFPDFARRVLQDVKGVYDESFLAYNRWAHGWDKKMKYKDPRRVKKMKKKVGFNV